MVKRILLVAALAFLAPVPAVWLFYQYSEWLLARFKDIGVGESGAEALTFIFVVLAIGALFTVALNLLVDGHKRIGRWFKTGRFHA